MIQKGIIAQVIDKYTYKVRIPKYDKLEYATNSTKLEDLSSGIVCTIPGIDISYALGDVVLVSFENDEISKPIILGLLYRENKSDADISVSNVDSSLTEIQDSLNKIHSSNLYTHIKYSNDNGLTFTSLFSPLYHESIIDGEVVCQPLFDTDENINGIKIDKRTRNINWSIIDADNNDVTRNISIETTIFDSNGNIIKKTNKNDGEYNITINNSSQIDGDLYLTYKLFITKEYLDTLHVLLATDREPIGATPGDYIGLSLSTSSIPSIDPSDYSWLSFSALNSNINIDINNKIAKLSAELNAKLEELTDVVYYKEVTWTQAEVNEYCQTGYQGIWERDLENGYIGEIKEGSIFYISVYNTGDNISSPEDDSYGRLTLKALMDAGETDDVLGVVIEYLVSGEVAINALARFKSDLLAPNDQTLIYGGHITTGHIQDYSGKNFIQLTDESGRGKAGHLEFKNADTWEASTSGLQWNTYYEPAEEIPENLKGTLSVKGDVYANSLTIIGAGGNTYSGTAAINISGYSIEIEKDADDVEEDVSVYLYPILYHNGIKLDEYGLSDDKVVDTSKTYYTRSGEPGSYTYAEVQNPIGNPHNNNYYEKQIDYTHFVWYEDDITPGTTGDPDRGKILAFYRHVYKVTYDFDDGAVDGGTEIQTREVDPSKYITKTGDESITVHPEYWENRSSYISLNTDGLNIFNRYGNSIAQYGSTARIGLDNSSRFLMNSGSLEAYDSSNNKYFEVSSSGLSWGNNTAATVADLANKANASDVADAAKTAINYITTVNSGGISIHDENDSTGRNILINSNNISIRNDEFPLMILDDDSLEFNVLDNETSAAIASFGKNTRLGREEFGYAKLHLSSDELLFLSADSTEIFNTGVASEEHSTSRIHIDADWNSSQTLGLVLSDYTIAANETVTAYGTYYSSTIHNIPLGTTFTLEIQMHNAAASWGTAIFKNDFVKGTEATLTNYLPQDYFATSVYYDGDASFTLSGTITNRSSVTWNIIDDKGVFTGETEVIESVVYNTSIGGNAFINESNGGVYLCLPQKNEYRSSDRKLYNIINTLGWNDEVFAGIKLAEHTKTISRSGMIIDNIIELSFLPLTATDIEVESSDTSVIDGGYIYFDDDDDYRIYFLSLNVEGNGTCTVTVKMTFADEVYSDSCEITVTGGSGGGSGVETPTPIG